MSGQDFNSVQLCHNADKTLNYIATDYFILKFSKAVVTGFATKDGLVEYSAKEMLFTIKNEKPADRVDSVIKLKLTSKGPAILQNDTSIILDSALLSDPAVFQEGFTHAYKRLNGFVFDLRYKNNSLDKIRFNVKDRSFTITVENYSNEYYWNILCQKINSESGFLLTYIFSKLELVSLR